MTPAPDLDRRVTRNQHDIEDLYLMLDETNTTVSRIDATQQEHSATLARHGAILDEHSAKLDSLTTTVNEHSVELDEQTAKLDDHGTKLDEILTILRSGRDTPSGAQHLPLDTRRGGHGTPSAPAPAKSGHQSAT